MVPNGSTTVTNYYNSLVSGRQQIFDGKASQLSSSFPSNNVLQTNPTPPSNVLCNICNQSLDSVKSYHKHLIASHPENAVEVLCAGKNTDYNCFVVKSLSHRQTFCATSIQILANEMRDWAVSAF